MRQVDELVARAIVVLHRSREFDTADIAEVVVESEAVVVAVLAEAKAGQRDFAEVAAPRPDSLPGGERGKAGA